MALIDVVKWEVSDKEFCYKFPSEDLRIGTQLVVYAAQTAFFVKGGKVCDEFSSGTYTINAENIPLLNKLINIPFGGKSPFKAEVWFVNQISKLDIKWGTPQPIQVEDPGYKIVVPVRAFGQYGIRISNPRLFLETLIGNMSNFSADKINQYFKGKVTTQLNSLISSKITQEKISILDINSQLIEMSDYCNLQLNKIFGKYGIDIIEFSIASINVPENDPSFIQLKKSKDLAAKFAIVGAGNYTTERGFDVLQTAAANEGAGGQIASLGAGFGASIGIGKAIGQIATQGVQNTTPVTPPPVPQETTYFLYYNGQQIGGQTIHNIAALLAQGHIHSDTWIWKPGLPEWVKIYQMPELASLLNQQTPPPIPSQM